jgi:hypothetical protein
MAFAGAFPPPLHFQDWILPRLYWIQPPAAMKRCTIQPGFESGMSSIAAEIRECLSVLIAGNQIRFVKKQQS